MPHARRSFAWLWPRLIAVCAAFVLLGDVWGLLHTLTVRHVRCPYDGALVHIDELDQTEVPAAGSLEHHRKPAFTAAHHHRSCDALTAVHRAAFLAPATPSGRHCELACTVLAQLTPQSYARLSALTYAPKQSPPDLS